MYPIYSPQEAPKENGGKSSQGIGAKVLQTNEKKSTTTCRVAHFCDDFLFCFLACRDLSFYFTTVIFMAPPAAGSVFMRFYPCSEK